MKHERFSSYSEDSLLSAETALLTVWPSLLRYHNDLVLVGGLAVKHVTKRVGDLPGGVTLDVDLGISLAASGGMYGTIESDLAGLGFVHDKSRMVRKQGNTNLYIDFLTEDPRQQALGSRNVDDVVASVVPGINRALACYRGVLVKGNDVYGGRQECEVKVADVGPLLVLKLNGFGGPTGRRATKDAYDILLLGTGYVDGPIAAINGFLAEGQAGNPAYGVARTVLEKYFSEIDHDGPIRAAEFLGLTGERRNRVCQDVVTLGRRLLDE